MTSNHRAELEAAYQKKVVQRLERTVRQVGLIVFGEIVSNTPVDTGRARGNWNIDLNAPDLSNENAPNPSGDTSKAAPLVASYKLDDKIFIANNLPYIRRLDEGHSTQAPAGFVDAAIQVGVQKASEL
jgi:hypothetical protein